MNENDKWEIFCSISFDRYGTPADEQFIPADVHNLYLCMDGGLLVYRRLKKKEEKKETHLQSFIATNSPSISFEQEFSLWRSFLSFFFFFSIIYEHSFVCKIFLETTGIRGNNNKKKRTNDRKRYIFFDHIFYLFFTCFTWQLSFCLPEKQLSTFVSNEEIIPDQSRYLFSRGIKLQLWDGSFLEHILKMIYIYTCILNASLREGERNGGCIDSIENLRIWVRYRTSFLHRFEMRVNASYRIHRGS